jgi:hypothetical protein
MVLDLLHAATTADGTLARSCLTMLRSAYIYKTRITRG